MQKKKLLGSIFAILVLTTGFSMFADNSTQGFSSPQEFDAVATPVCTLTVTMGFNDDYRGFVTYTPPAGTFFKGPTLDTEGNVVEEGDLLIQMATIYRQADVDNAKANIAKDEAILAEKKEVYLRDKKLNETHSVSLQAYQAANSDYLQAEAQLKADKANLILKQRILELCQYRAQFDGIVNKIIFPAGYTGGERPIMEVSQLFPMGINIKMPRALADQIKVDTPITVYPVNSNEKIGAIHGYAKLTDNGVQLVVNNFPSTPEYVTEDGKKLKVVYEFDTVMPFDFINQDDKNKVLAINEACINKDSKGGYYLWKAVGEKNGQPGKGVSKVIQVKKVEITPGNEVKRISPSVKYINLKDADGLEPYDMVLRDKVSDLNDNDSVYFCYEQERYLFMPGDPVKVIIGGQQK